MVEAIPPSVMLMGAMLVFLAQRRALAHFSDRRETAPAVFQIFGPSMVMVSGIVVGFSSIVYALASRDRVLVSSLWIVCAATWAAVALHAHRVGRPAGGDNGTVDQNESSGAGQNDEVGALSERRESGPRKIPARYFGVPGMMLLVIPQFIIGFLDEPAGPIASAVIFVIVAVAVVLMCTGAFILFRDMGDRAEQEYRESRDH